MTTNPFPQAFPGDHRSSVRGGSSRPKAGHTPAAPAVSPFSVDAAPKVWIKGISLSYATGQGTRLLALDQIDLKVKSGEFLCIVGPSGCGKSTLLHLIAGLNQASSGQVLIADKSVEGPGTDRILIFQELGLFPWLTVGENVEFGMKMKGVSKAERTEKTQQYLRLVHLAQFKNSYTHQLSGGMRQRVALARALASEPDVLLMDEPFAALDAQTRDLLHDELERIWRETGRTIIFVTHNVREAVRLGDRVALLTFRPGRVKREFSVNLPRPRQLEDVTVAKAAREILDDLREEINKSLEVEYGLEENASMKRLAKHAIFYAVLLGTWLLLAQLKIWPPYLFPTPQSVVQSLWAGFADHSFWIAIGVSMRRMLLGYALSVTLGIVLGLGVASNKFLEETMGGLLVKLQSLPSICWLPLAVLWFGLSEKAILFVVVMGSLLSVTIAMEDGRRQMPKIYGMAGRNWVRTGFVCFGTFLLPASLPFLVSGLKQGWAFAWRSLISGEMIFVSLGLGQLLMMGRDLNDMSQVLAVMFLIIAIGYVVDGLVFRTVERRLHQKWGLAPAA